MPRPRRLAAPETPADAAAAAGLRYVSDEGPCIRRLKAARGGGFRYIGPDGKPVRDECTLARIRALAIPPAWEDVWICPTPHGHIQATGRDAKGRKQYRYHPRWRAVRDGQKYDRLIAFGEALPTIRRTTDEHLRLRGLPREKVLAAVVQLLDETSIRIGNEEYRRQNRSFGLTTLQDRHARFPDGSTVRFQFRGKSGVRHSVELHDRRLARVVRQCQEIPGQELFQYLDEQGQRHTISSEDVNGYLRAISGGDFSAKDFRTFNGTVLAASLLHQCEPCASQTQGKHQLAETIRQVAAHLGNTPAVCRKAYIHPAVVDSYLRADLASVRPRPSIAEADDAHGLSEDERFALALLRREQSEAAAAHPQAA